MAVQLKENSVVCRRAISPVEVSVRVEKRSKKVFKFSKLVENVCAAISVLLIVWCIASVVDIDMHNTAVRSAVNHPSSWNAFELFVSYTNSGTPKMN